MKESDFGKAIGEADANSNVDANADGMGMDRTPDRRDTQESFGDYDHDVDALMANFPNAGNFPNFNEELLVHPEAEMDKNMEDEEEEESPTRYLMFKQLFSWFTLMVLLGVLIGLNNVAFHFTTHEISHWWSGICYSQEDEWMRYTLRGVGVLGSSIVTGMITSFVISECCGGGMLAVKLCLATDTSIPLHVGFSRFLITAVYIGFGNTLGVEAPTLHISASIACFLFETAKLAVGTEVFPEVHLNTVVMIGCTCGIACAFDTPFGGIIFVGEEFLRGSSASRTFMLLLCICVTFGVFTTRTILGNKTFFDVELDHGGSSAPWMFYAVPCGVLGALGAVGFVRITLKIKATFHSVFSEDYDENPPTKIKIAQKLLDAPWRPFWAGLVTSILGIITWKFTIEDPDGPVSRILVLEDDMLENSDAIVDEFIPYRQDSNPYSSNYLRSIGSSRSSAASRSSRSLAASSSSGYSRHIGDKVFYSGKSDLELLMSEDLKIVHLLLFFISKLIAVCWCVAADASGGVFYPSLVLGGALGGIVSQICKFQCKNMIDDGRTDITSECGEVLDLERYKLIVIFGMMSFFSAVIRCPLSAVVIIYEMTNVGKTRADLIFPSLAASLVSYMLAQEMQEQGIYEAMLDQTGIDFEDEDDEELEEDLGHPTSSGGLGGFMTGPVTGASNVMTKTASQRSQKPVWNWQSNNERLVEPSVSKRISSNRKSQQMTKMNSVRSQKSQQISGQSQSMGHCISGNNHRFGVGSIGPTGSMGAGGVGGAGVNLASTSNNLSPDGFKPTSSLGSPLKAEITAAGRKSVTRDPVWDGSQVRSTPLNALFSGDGNLINRSMGTGSQAPTGSHIISKSTGPPPSTSMLRRGSGGNTKMAADIMKRAQERRSSRGEPKDI